MDSSIQAFPEDSKLLPEALKQLGPDQLLVSEFFLSIQGESSYAGRPCFFIRLAGCQLRCNWCDTPYAFQGGSVFTIEECVRKGKEAGVPLVEVTGGEPLLQPAARPLLRQLANAGFKVLLETSGAVGIDGLDPRVVRIVDIKCPGSGVVERNLPGIDRDLRATDELKFVIADRADFEWACSWMVRRKTSLPSGIPIHFSPAHGRLHPEELASWILQSRVDVRLNLQIHKLIWGSERRGV